MRPAGLHPPFLDPQNGRRLRARRRAAWKPAWKACLGTYRLSLYAEPLWYARLLLATGLPRAAHIRVRRQGDTMTIDGIPRLEHEPDLFFSKAGEALDFRCDPHTGRNIALTKR